MRPWFNEQPETRGRLTSWLTREHLERRRTRAARVPRARIQVSSRGMVISPLPTGGGDGSSGGREPRWA